MTALYTPTVSEIQTAIITLGNQFRQEHAAALQGIVDMNNALMDQASHKRTLFDQLFSTMKLSFASYEEAHQATQRAGARENQIARNNARSDVKDKVEHLVPVVAGLRETVSSRGGIPEDSAQGVIQRLSSQIESMDACAKAYSRMKNALSDLRSELEKESKRVVVEWDTKLNQSHHDNSKAADEAVGDMVKWLEWAATGVDSEQSKQREILKGRIASGEACCSKFVAANMSPTKNKTYSDAMEEVQMAKEELANLSEKGNMFRHLLSTVQHLHNPPSKRQRLSIFSFMSRA